MWHAMEHFHPPVFVKDNEEGIKRVEKDNPAYAFFMESSTILYATKTHCQLEAVGPKLDEKSYGIGMPLNSQYRDQINKAILKLHEDFTIKKIHEKWWNKEVDDGELPKCIDEKPEGATDLPHIYGIFVVLAVGMVLSFIAGIIEFLWNVRKISITEKVQRNIL